MIANIHAMTNWFKLHISWFFEIDLMDTIRYKKKGQTQFVDLQVEMEKVLWK